MVTPPSIITDDRGHNTVIKSGTGALGDRRRREAEVLEQVRHPGVVELLDRIDEGDRVELHLDHVPGPSLADHPPLTVGELARVAAAVAETLADVHDAGIAHGHVAADHILLAGDRVVLCGLADATTADDASAPADVVALCRLVRRQVDRSVDAGTADGADSGVDRLRTVLDEVVAEAELVGDGAQAPAARRVAARLAEIADTAAGRERTGLRGRLPRRGLTVAAAAVVVALTAAAALVVVRSLGPGRTDPAEASSSAAAPTTTESGGTPPEAPADPSTGPRDPSRPTATTTPGTTAPATTTPGTTTSATTRPATVSPAGTDPSLVLAAPTPCEPVGDGWSAADVDGDGCPDRWRASEGVLEVGGLRYSLGGPADLVAVGDWDCDGAATPALVAVESGGVFLFPQWAGAGTDVTVEAVGVVAGPTGLEVTTVDGCDVLGVSGTDDEQRFGGRP